MARHDRVRGATSRGNGYRRTRALKDGLYAKFGKPNFALGFHDKADLETGHIGVTEGYTSANVDSVDITVRGVGGHGAYPHKTKDPIVLAAQIINALQTIASRENNPLDPVVITVGSIHGGTKRNIIPDDVKLLLTVRTYKSDIRERVLTAIDQIVKGCAIAAEIPPDRAPIVTVSKDERCPAMYNNPELTKRLVAVWKKSLGNENVEIVDPTMGGEDFSEYSLADPSIPAVNFHFGAVDPAKMAEYKQRGKRIAKPAFEQVRTRSRTNDPCWNHRNDKRCARIDEEISCSVGMRGQQAKDCSRHGSLHS